jgi:hypothetical protein
VTPEGLAFLIVAVITVWILWEAFFANPLSVFVAAIIFWVPIAMGLHFLLKHAFRALW